MSNMITEVPDSDETVLQDKVVGDEESESDDEVGLSSNIIFASTAYGAAAGVNSTWAWGGSTTSSSRW